MSKALNKNHLRGKFFGRKEVQRILNMGIAPFVYFIKQEKPDEALLFLAGGAFGLGCNGCDKEAAALVAEARKHFPEAGLEKILGYLKEVHRSGNKPGIKAQYAYRISQEFDGVKLTMS